MAFIRYVPEREIPEAYRVDDHDHIIRIHGLHPKVMRHHYDLYVEIMRGPGPLRQAQREMIAVAVSVANECRY